MGRANMIRLTSAGKFWLSYAVFLILLAYAAPDLVAWWHGFQPVMVTP